MMACLAAQAQFVMTHKVKKKETIFGISKTYGISQEQLIQANPEMETPGYKLKKGDVINIPVVAGGQNTTVSYTADDVRLRSIRLGVVMPLHGKNNDGKRMLEYYRGMLMACDSLKTEGISVDVYAWNAAETTDINSLLGKIAQAKCDIIFGPFYPKHVDALSSFCKEHKCMLVIPFSLDVPQIYSNKCIFQIYQPANEQVYSTVRRFADWFKNCRPIIIDCGDNASTKVEFTSALRKELEEKGIYYRLSSLATEDESLLKAMATDRPNIVLLNTARLTDISTLYKKLDAIRKLNSTVSIGVFGYTEWLGAIYTHQPNFHRYDTYIPTTFYTNLSSPLTLRLQQRYRWNFHQDMSTSLPRFALTGFDHTIFFLRGLHNFGAQFDGAAGRLNIQPVQTPLKFERVGEGGYENRAYMFMHFKPDYTIDAINY